jgi:predicted alpha/beta superfamily hydrolase
VNSLFVLALTIVISCILSSCSNIQALLATDRVNEPRLDKLPPYELPSTQTFTLDSVDTGNTYKITVALPGSYADSPSDKTYPVLYVLDSQWQFPLFHTIVGAIHHDGDMPEVIIVGISWQEKAGNLMALRNLDLTPTILPNQAFSGGAKKFQNFFRNSLFPHIETSYKANQKRTVTGGSTSALFVYYTLLSKPDLFDGYIATSPTVSWDDKALMRILAQSPINAIAQPKRAYLAWGSLEGAQDIEDFARQLTVKNMTNLDFRYAPVINAGHAGVNAEGFTKGLQFIYARPAVQVAASALNQLTGVYRANDGEEITFSVEDGNLMVTYPGWATLQLTALNDHTFYARGNNIELNFVKNKDNPAAAVNHIMHGKEVRFSR